MKLELMSYRYADSVLNHASFRNAKAELFQVLRNTTVSLLAKPKHRKRGGRESYFSGDQKALNKHLNREFASRGWSVQPLVVDLQGTQGPRTGLKADFKKGRLQVEVQFGNMARWYSDVFKFQLSYSTDEIDAAAIVVAKQRFANLIDESIAHYERDCRELPRAKISLTLPILVIGVEPEDYQPLRHAYNRATKLSSNEVIPFDH